MSQLPPVNYLAGTNIKLRQPAQLRAANRGDKATRDVHDRQNRGMDPLDRHL
jgi:hypothetical protein